MPVIGIPVDMLLSRIGTTLDRDDLVEHLQHLGCDVEGYATLRRYRCCCCDNILEITETENPPVACDRCGADYRENEALRVELGESDVIRMELLAVRPDMFDPGGLARVLRNYLGENPSVASYQLSPPSCHVDVEPALAEETSFRPRIACAIVRGISLDDDAIKVIMKLQENLHWALGRDRKHASIGVYDLSTVQGPGFVYRTVGPEELTFTPLGYDPADPAQKVTPATILAEHPKGKAYARLLSGFDRYPLLCDATGAVLSLPPIINSEQTRLRQSTRDFFIDVTGSEERVVERALNILVTSLLELDPKVKVEQVTIRYSDSERVTPDLSPQVVRLDPEHVARTIGVPLSEEDVVRHLQQMGHAVERERASDGDATEAVLLSVSVPAYRNDIMHPIDLIEDVAIAYGYHNIEPTLVPTMTVGVELPAQALANVCRRALCGLGYLEVLTLILSSEQRQFDALGLPRPDDCVLIAHPISVEQTIIRMTLIPGLLDTFGVNTDHEMPQRIFEVGDISVFDPAAETGASEHLRLAAGAIGPKVDYSTIRSACASLLRELGWTLEVEAEARGCFIPGRSARIYARRLDERRAVGWMGEVHPQTLERFKLVQPTSVFEVDLEKLAAL